MINLAIRSVLIDHAVMWLFTQYGFYSAVCARQGDGDHGQPVDPDRIMVRARRREHLDRLLARFAETLNGIVIHDSVGTDYRYRIFVDKAVWTAVTTDLTNELDYDNFKSAVAKRLAGELDGHDYEHALHDVWEVMYSLQQNQ